MAMLVSIECYSETSIKCFFMFCCYSVSIVYSSIDVFYIINFMFFLHFIICCMCVCHTSVNVLTYLLLHMSSMFMNDLLLRRIVSTAVIVGFRCDVITCQLALSIPCISQNVFTVEIVACVRYNKVC